MKKNKRLMIIVGMLLLVGGISMAYFVGKMLTSGEGASTSVITANIKNSEVKVEGTLQFENYEGMLPGHKEPSIIKVTAIGDNELIPYNVVWEGRNGLGTPLNFTIYRLDESITISAECEEVREKVSGGIALSEKCSITNEENLGKVIGSGEIPSNQDNIKVELKSDEFITSTEGEGTSVYYYVVLEYPNENDSQNDDMGHNFDGEVTIEASDVKPDVDIVAIRLEQDDGSYKETDDIPDISKYKLNIEESTCNNNSKAIWDYENNGVTITNLKQKGTQCYLQFDKLSESEGILANLGRVEATESVDFSKIDISEHTSNGKSKLFKAEDDFGTTYYFRGEVNDNWVQFGKDSSYGYPIWWRIVRINGDGTIRLIYAGIGTIGGNVSSDYGVTGKGTSSQISTTSAWAENSSTNTGIYVGYERKSKQMHGYGTGSTKSKVVETLNSWFKSNLNNMFMDGEGLIDSNAGFCNDRSNSKISSETWSESMEDSGDINTNSYFGAYLRLRSGGNNPSSDNPATPTFKCSTNYQNSNNLSNKITDYFTYTGATTGTKSLDYPVGLITADEVAFA